MADMTDEPFESDVEQIPLADGDQRRLVVDLDGYEGPLDMLLALARQQKVDLARISILQLAEQYVDYIERAHELDLDIAADHLVMAAWLAYLKSRLLLPDPPGDEEPSGEELAAALSFQLRRLEAMRAAGEKIMALPRLGCNRRRFTPSCVPIPIRGATTCLYRGASAVGLTAWTRPKA